MAEPLLITSLLNKIVSVEAYIADLKKRIEAARQDLVHLRATVHLLNQDAPEAPPVHMGISRAFRRGEITELALAALREAPGALDSCELAAAVMIAKGINPDEKGFRQALTGSITTMFRRMALQGQVRDEGRRGTSGRVHHHRSAMVGSRTTTRLRSQSSTS